MPLIQRSRLTRYFFSLHTINSSYTNNHVAINPTSPATQASTPAPADLAPAADEVGAFVAAAPAEDVVEASAVTVLVPMVVVVAAEAPLVPELTAAELVSVPITVVDVGATDEVAGPSATSVAVACPAVALMPTMDRTHEAAASE